MKEQIASDQLASKGSEVTVVGAGIYGIMTSVVSFLTTVTISEWAAATGIVVALSGWLYRHRESKLVSSKAASEKAFLDAQTAKVNAEIDEINRRVAFMEKAGLHPKTYHQVPPELEALKPEGEQEA